MDLREYMFFNKVTAQALSEKVMVSRHYISMISCKRARPSRRLAKSIEEATDGRVKARSLLKIPKPKTKPKAKEPRS